MSKKPLGLEELKAGRDIGENELKRDAASTQKRYKKALISMTMRDYDDTHRWADDDHLSLATVIRNMIEHERILRALAAEEGATSANEVFDRMLTREKRARRRSK